MDSTNMRRTLPLSVLAEEDDAPAVYPTINQIILLLVIHRGTPVADVRTPTIYEDLNFLREHCLVTAELQMTNKGLTFVERMLAIAL